MLTVELSPRQFDILEVSSQDDLAAVVQAFCQLHNLPSRVHIPFVSFLQQELNQLVHSGECMAHAKLLVHSLAPHTPRRTLSAGLGYCDLSSVKKRMQRDRLRLGRLPQHTLCKASQAEALIKSGLDRERRLQEKRLAVRQEELAQCTFAPVINRCKRVAKDVKPPTKGLAQRLFARLDAGCGSLQVTPEVQEVLAPFVASLGPAPSFTDFQTGLEYFCKFLAPEDLEAVHHSC